MKIKQRALNVMLDSTPILRLPTRLTYMKAKQRALGREWLHFVFDGFDDAPKSRRSRGRPPTMFHRVLREQIAVFALWMGPAMDPGAKPKQIIGWTAALYGVNRSYVYRILQNMNSERRKIMEAGVPETARILADAMSRAAAMSRNPISSK